MQTITIPIPCYEETANAHTWLKAFEKLTIANGWTAKQRSTGVLGYLKSGALDWAVENVWSNWEEFSILFLERYGSRKSEVDLVHEWNHLTFKLNDDVEEFIRKFEDGRKNIRSLDLVTVIARLEEAVPESIRDELERRSITSCEQAYQALRTEVLIQKRKSKKLNRAVVGPYPPIAQLADYRRKGVYQRDVNNFQQRVRRQGCWKCGSNEHFKRDCPERNEADRGIARDRLDQPTGN